MVTSDFRPKVEIRPLRVCAMKYMQYNPGRIAEISRLIRIRGRWTRWWR